ncbi:MAG: response regulator transcription factor [Pirellulaceae bacterium]
MHSEPTVFVVDDDELTRLAVCALVRSMGVRAESFASAEEFLDKYTEDRPGCLVTDLRMLGMSGVELQENLARRTALLPVIIMTAYARTPVTVRVIQAGAITVLDKPCHDDDLWNAIRRALAEGEAARAHHMRHQACRTRLAQLTPQERQILDMTIDGASIKVIAVKLDISERTVARCRSGLLAKMQADSIADLLRMVTQAETDTYRRSKGCCLGGGTCRSGLHLDVRQKPAISCSQGSHSGHMR